MNEVSIFDGFIPYYKITKPVKLIELFAGIGSQHQALKNLGVNIVHSTIVEWQVNSIQAYNDIHVRKYDDWTQGLTKEEIAFRLNQLGVSLDYNEPAKLETLLRKGEEWLRNVYNNIINTNNKVNIMSVKAEHLNITETNKYDYILTYSFPCQDLSKAGKGKGMSDTNTRSGLLWEVERILSECKELPQVLLMENVPDVIGSNYIKDFNRWEERLRELGYSNHLEILNAKDYGVPQNRERAFMISILGNYQYRFPQPIMLNIKLKDILEINVDKKYYLTNEKIQSISQWKAQQDPFENMEKISRNGISPTLTARGAGEEHSGMILIKEELFKSKDKRLPEMLDKIDFDSDEPQVLDLYNRSVHDTSRTLTLPNHNSQALYEGFKIRKLTPKESYRLMGFSDEAFDKAKDNQTDTSLYHQAGDSIVVNVLMALFGSLING